ncbi:hypothetical protein LY76DRAFT_424316 [Colletotrichum caudatum]|nr:hypothetical protein LY76DRAFT_424316 [Colletotrichum caudatum]
MGGASVNTSRSLGSGRREKGVPERSIRHFLCPLHHLLSESPGGFCSAPFVIGSEIAASHSRASSGAYSFPPKGFLKWSWGKPIGRRRPGCNGPALLDSRDGGLFTYQRVDSLSAFPVRLAHQLIVWFHAVGCGSALVRAHLLLFIPSFSSLFHRRQLCSPLPRYLWAESTTPTPR